MAWPPGCTGAVWSAWRCALNLTLWARPCKVLSRHAGHPGVGAGRPAPPGRYGLTNTGSTGNYGILLTPLQVLTSAWFGRNEYYGFGAGADQITIFALRGITGYRIDRRELGQKTGNSVADDFTFEVPNQVPEPPVGLLVLAAGWAGLVLAKRRVGRRSHFR